MTNPYLKVLLQFQRKAKPVVPFNPSVDKLQRFDLTGNNPALTETIINDTALFSSYVEQQLAVSGARYGIGGYGEHRTIYSRSSLFDADTGTEPRRLHLGTDIWGPAGTPVSSPFDGKVHSVANNNQRGDYGGTIILEHHPDDIIFYTLYGHLSLRSVEQMETGKPVNAGEIFAWFGKPEENGQWPPHLHFQLVIDLDGRKGDYPGVCRFTEKEQWMKNSPDPDLVLQMNRFVSA